MQIQRRSSIAKVVNLYGMTIKVIDSQEKDAFLTQDDKDMDINGWFDDSKESYVTKQKYESICKHTVYPSDLLMSTFISDNVIRLVTELRIKL